PYGASLKHCREDGESLVVPRLVLVTHLDPGVSQRGSQRYRTLGHHRAQCTAADRLDRSTQVLGDVDQVAADVTEGAGTRPAAVPPADRCARVATVVAPVVAVEVQRLAERSGSDLLADGADRRRSTKRIADGVDQVAS